MALPIFFLASHKALGCERQLRVTTVCKAGTVIISLEGAREGSVVAVILSDTVALCSRIRWKFEVRADRAALHVKSGVGHGPLRRPSS